MSTATKTAGGKDTSGRNRRTRVLHALEQGPMYMRQLAIASNVDYEQLGSLLALMVAEHSVIVLGTVGELGITGSRLRADARVYALPGTDKADEFDSGESQQATSRSCRARPHAGSGQVAGPIVIGRRMMQHWGR